MIKSHTLTLAWDIVTYTDFSLCTICRFSYLKDLHNSIAEAENRVTFISTNRFPTDTTGLTRFPCVQDEWLNCQRSWLYLESIFSAPDIQRQLPSEAKMFMQVDKSYKDVMRKVNKVPLAIRAATQPGE